ncbi:unnamed protein product [Adineta steineri]|uniref:Uncharacterized protein n=1 Tax=Adineta steineri TaxID=433720 RepID=A0A815WF52_9BILA|nr:unnamed protein product [Adineta steineri]CAF1543161.1 unnamed protein product [Adineta steineri]
MIIVVRKRFQHVSHITKFCFDESIIDEMFGHIKYIHGCRCLTKRKLSIMFILIIVLLFIINYNKLFCVKYEEETNKYSSLVYMSAEERNIIRLYLNKSHTMLEYGSGYSTLYFSQFVNAYYSIEHNEQWYKTIKSLIDHSPIISSIIKKYILIHINPGYKGWLGGYSEGNKIQFHGYIHAVHSLNVIKFDRVLIDGRARVDCAFEISSYLDKNSIIFVHDYSNRDHYFNISKKYYKIILQTYEGQTLAAFKLR